MVFYKKSNVKLILIIVFLTVTLLIGYTVYTIQNNKNNLKALEPISINLITSVHPSLPWTFKALKSKVITNPGEVISIEYQVENISDERSTGIATFSYYPKSFGDYISKLNCFCYDAQTLKPKQKDDYSFVILIDPEVTKDSKTKNIKEVTIQFNFFNYKEYKEY